MTKPQNPITARLIPLLVVGMMLNTSGIVLTSLGNARFALSAVGIAMILTFLVKVLAARRSGSKPDAP